MYNCKYQGPPKPMINEADLSLLKLLCPHLYNGTDTVTCCDTAQLHRFNEDFSLPRQLMSRCPACFRNFRSFLCDFTCGPQQSEYLTIVQEKPYNPPNSTLHQSDTHQDYESDTQDDYDEDAEARRKKRQAPTVDQQYAITEINYTISVDFVDALYDSCK